ncbi:hypothetical protein D3C71_1593130 [compost metagenome]
MHVQLQPEFPGGGGAHVLQQGGGRRGQHERQARLVRGARQMHIGLGPEQAIQSGGPHDGGHGRRGAQHRHLQPAIRDVHQHVGTELQAGIGRRVARQRDAVFGSALEIIECQPGQASLRLPPVIHHAGKHFPSLICTVKLELHIEQYNCISIIPKTAIRDSH